jgi:mRNA-degrading endonuclease YafQ of YafQ-DinJ toxin-antitoxin module
MIIKIDNSFKKDFKKLKNKEIEKRVIDKLELLEKSENLDSISNVKIMH